LWFIQEILPIIRKQIGCVSFTIAGTNKLVSHPTLAGENIKILGRIDDLSGVYNDSRLFIAPTRYSAGIPHKIHEAASRGLPVAATSLLAKQLDWSGETDLLVGDDPIEFAKQCIRLHSEPQTWGSIRAGALKRITNECSPAAFKANLRSILNGSNRNAIDVPQLTAVWRSKSSSAESTVKIEV
jgi:glycosyltransferase involved in cell wall biosynthesis